MRCVCKIVFVKGYSKLRWSRAKELQTLHEIKTGEKLKLREFYKTENPATKGIIKYNVTYSMSILKPGEYEFFIPQDSIEVYSYGNFNKQYIEDSIKDTISDVFRGKSKSTVYSNLDIEAVEIRGYETEKVEYFEADTYQLTTKGVYNNGKLNVNVGKTKGKSTTNNNDYSLNIYF